MAVCSSQEEGPEYKTMRECNGKMVELLHISIEKLGDALFAKKLISLEFKKSLRNTAQSEENRTREVIENIISNVKYTPKVFYDFVDILNELDYKNLVEQLLSCCHKHQTQATPPHPPPSPDNSRNSPSPEPSPVTAGQSQIIDKLILIDAKLTSLQDYQNKGSIDAERSQERESTNSSVVAGTKDILLIVSKMSGPNIVPRRNRPPLTEEEKQKLREQGVHEDCCINDLTIMLAREELDKKGCSSAGVLTGELRSCKEVRERITELFNTTDKAEVVLHYIGPGQKKSGNWCFKDGFISLEEIMELYTRHLKPRGRVLTIVSDCSYSGRWVKEAMTFMDGQGVGPCGHQAKEKGILVKVFASCLANEVPAELAFSTLCANNDKAGTVSYLTSFKSKTIYSKQHPTGIDFTDILCEENKIDQPCTMPPHSTWKQWGDGMRTYTINGKDKKRGSVVQCVFQVNDDKKSIQEFEDEVREMGEVKIDKDWIQVLMSGRGEIPYETYVELLRRNAVNYRPLTDDTGSVAPTNTTTTITE